jgi:hypothetical protein
VTYDGGFQLGRDELFQLAEGLDAAKAWTDAAAVMKEAIAQYPFGTDGMRIRLATILAGRLDRPQEAIDVLDGLDPDHVEGLVLPFLEELAAAAVIVAGAGEHGLADINHDHEAFGCVLDIKKRDAAALASATTAAQASSGPPAVTAGPDHAGDLVGHQLTGIQGQHLLEIDVRHGRHRHWPGGFGGHALGITGTRGGGIVLGIAQRLLPQLGGKLHALFRSREFRLRWFDEDLPDNKDNGSRDDEGMEDDADPQGPEGAFFGWGIHRDFHGPGSGWGGNARGYFPHRLGYGLIHRHLPPSR